ncbi:hypothetical protein L1987_57504 [Smallanthus sonchifolius]|uniref:Uncharacterized protein n=1 Tax=Smallanthus sonchifolius TaxID=185202 RepID=A0ACB9DCT1_9ASTR|nr:hypothetical protein L1987_57504 [Smallanthus sonchifolius]
MQFNTTFSQQLQNFPVEQAYNDFRLSQPYDFGLSQRFVSETQNPNFAYHEPHQSDEDSDETVTPTQNDEVPANPSKTMDVGSSRKKSRPWTTNEEKALATSPKIWLPETNNDHNPFGSNQVLDYFKKIACSIVQFRIKCIVEPTLRADAKPVKIVATVDEEK